MHLRISVGFPNFFFNTLLHIFCHDDRLSIDTSLQLIYPYSWKISDIALIRNHTYQHIVEFFLLKDTNWNIGGTICKGVCL